MDIYKGKSASVGIAIGKVYIYKRNQHHIEKKFVSNTRHEVKRYKKAMEMAIDDLNTMHEEAVNETGRSSAAIFDAHKMIINDIGYQDKIIEMIKKDNVNAEYAVKKTTEKYIKAIIDMEEAYIRDRAVDLQDVSDRLIYNLKGEKEEKIKFSEKVIIFAEELTPSETIRFDKKNVVAFVTNKGSENSHAAILAKTMEIPALVGVEYVGRIAGKQAIVDAYSGDLYVDPSESIFRKMTEKRDEYLKKREILLEFRGKENVTTDGRKINILSNIGNVDDVESVLYNDAGGIGLFRSEFLYLGKKQFPTLKEQYDAYKEVALKMRGKKVIIRTLDIGADKKIDYFNLDDEENPFMGYRAVRICLDRRDIFKTQLKAIYMASIFGDIKVMYPMIVSVDEIKTIKEITEEVKFELKSENKPFKDIEQGIMIETPAAAIISDELAKHVDFFSIGTNDLTQYILAMDRLNSKLDKYYDPHHSAIFKFIKMIVENGHKEGIEVAICGELASDTYYTKDFIDIGVDEISVSPSKVLEMRKVIREI